MVSFNLFKAVSFLALATSLVSAQSGVDCSRFRVTSPNVPFTTTAGQCYRVSFDLGPNPPATPAPISVDLYEYGTNRFVSNAVTRASTGNGIATPWFNIDLGELNRTGVYYFVVTYDECAPIATSYFNVLYNPNSGTATCPA